MGRDNTIFKLVVFFFSKTNFLCREPRLWVTHVYMRLLTKTEVKMGGCWPFFESYSCASFKSAQTSALCNQCVESLTRIFFSKSIFAASLSSCFNEGTRNWHMFATTRVVSISLTITGVKNIVRFTEVSLYRGSLHEGSSVLSQSSSSSLVHKIIWAQLIILCDPPILTMWATR